MTDDNNISFTTFPVITRIRQSRQTKKCSFFTLKNAIPLTISASVVIAKCPYEFVFKTYKQDTSHCLHFICH